MSQFLAKLTRYREPTTPFGISSKLLSNWLLFFLQIVNTWNGRTHFSTAFTLSSTIPKHLDNGLLTRMAHCYGLNLDSVKIGSPTVSTLTYKILSKIMISNLPLSVAFLTVTWAYLVGNLRAEVRRTCS